MTRSIVKLGPLVLLAGLLGGSPVLLRSVRAQAIGENKLPPTDRPGDAMYTPTKLEWAALELQAYYGTNLTSETPVANSFSPLNDWRTVLCLLQYPADVSAGAVNTHRLVEEKLFEKYVQLPAGPGSAYNFKNKAYSSIRGSSSIADSTKRTVG